MGEILGVGLSHYPPLCGLDDRMSGLLKFAMDDDSIPAKERDPSNWSAAMQAEWADDEGLAAAGEHRAELVEGFRRVRSAIDDFAPDVLLIIGDDQYENFREDIIPPYAVLAYEDDMVLQPWKAKAKSAMIGGPNPWNEGEETSFHVRMAPEFGRELATGMLERGVDAAYAYKPNHYEGLSHAFTNALLFLDYDRTGLDYPVLPLAVNCYGRGVISLKGFITKFDFKAPPDPPSPGPKRMMQVGAALAQTILASDKRVAVVASSSWSHAFLCDKTYRIRPDTASDRALYDAMTRGGYEEMADYPLSNVEEAGQQELLNWFALWGAMQEAGHSLDWSTFVQTDVFNSNKIFAAYSAR